MGWKVHFSFTPASCKRHPRSFRGRDQEGCEPDSWDWAPLRRVRAGPGATWPAVCTWSRDVRCLSKELRTRGRVLALDAGIREGPIETGSDYGRCR
jgi:hypothetical protein